MSLDLSVVIPVHNESANVDPLCRELVESLELSGHTFEVILIDDGITDDTFAKLAAQQAPSGVVDEVQERLLRSTGRPAPISRCVVATERGVLFD